ncbi:MAG TPA: glycosyltransferase family 39 protein [Terriglobales bacterium]|nr:glycosyltransferase family 39 protein [Terriglobales bacterium]
MRQVLAVSSAKLLVLVKRRYIPTVRELLRKHPRFFVIATLAALALRLFFILRFPAITDDSKIYADIAKNWVQHGVYGISAGTQIVPTYARLPGYPAFLALIFAIFGRDHFRAVLCVQMVVDVCTCLVVADMARRLLSTRAAKVAFLAGALCPFLANYSAAVLTETLEVFFTALALDCAIAGLDSLDGGRIVPWVGCGLAVAGAILLRPDGGILLASIGLYLGWMLLNSCRRGWQEKSRLRVSRILAAGLTVALVALAPLVPWTIRNLHTLHRFQPLAPRYANEEGEAVPTGFDRWVKTWMADYVSVQEIYWNEPGVVIDASKLPQRAYDSPEQQRQTQELIAQYNEEQDITPELDRQFGQLAGERIRAAPLRYYLWLPALRIADMWLRPRTELLPADPRWWEFNDDLIWSVVSVGFGIINLCYVAAAAVGAARKPHLRWLGLLVVFVGMRSLFLGSLENPEPRYTLECYPVIVLLAANMLAPNMSVTDDAC